jgi:tRNA dimethylallyltransferase
MQKRLIIIAGPTGIGKTAKAIELALLLDAEVISADSRQIYHELNIGVAKPSNEELSQVPHHFINHISIHQPYNAGIYEQEVIQFLDQYFQTKDIAILCGGTGLYIDAVCNGLDIFPDISEQTLQIVENEFTQYGLEYISEKLSILDSVYFESIDKSNSRRVLRAYQVCIESGKPYSSFVTNTKKQRPFLIEKYIIEMDRNTLYNRINKRVDMMVEAGLIDEVRGLLSFKDIKALETVGYSELFDYFDNKCTLESAIDKIKQHSRNYAKRQWTWFRKHHEYRDVEEIIKL